MRRPTPLRSHPRIRKSSGLAVDAVFVAALALAVFIAYGSVGNRWYHVVAIMGGSMEPTITRGDLIVVTPPPSKIEVGMIVTMTADGRVVTHRVVEVRPDGRLVTKGDANDAVDHWNGTVTVDGVYAFTIPLIGRYIPIVNGSEASFVHRSAASQQIAIGPFADESRSRGRQLRRPSRRRRPHRRRLRRPSRQPRLALLHQSRQPRPAPRRQSQRWNLTRVRPRLRRRRSGPRQRQLRLPRQSPLPLPPRRPRLRRPRNRPRRQRPRRQRPT